MTTAYRTVSPATPAIGSFFEAQPFLKNRLVWWALVGSAVVAIAAGAAAALSEGASWNARIWPIASIVAATALAARMGIVTQMTSEGLQVRLWPFPFRTYAWSDIAKVEVRTYRPILEFGGWGLRWGPSGKAYSAFGTEGVQLVLTNGKRVLIGSQRASELAAAMNTYLS